MSIINNSGRNKWHIIIIPLTQYFKFQIMGDFQSLLNPDSVFFLLNLNWNTKLLTFLHVNAVKNSILVFVKCFSTSSKKLYNKNPSCFNTFKHQKTFKYCSQNYSKLHVSIRKWHQNYYFDSTKMSCTIFLCKHLSEYSKLHSSLTRVNPGLLVVVLFFWIQNF